ncbi:VOC family protein [Methanolobus bombayensis]|uniref:VOC family protein n=1 Tax=Methanolobus bombayensis TaxID=38023 RepID=UPI001AE460CB|nr:VOC family protein [Methanolobus bombayensis]MBP1909616.1 putative glyoxalase superfamily protein PhnB [Methanolobus bombayensis]
MKLNKLTPNFAVQDIRKTVSYYQDILGFNVLMAVPEDKSGIDNELNGDKTYIYVMMGRDGIDFQFQRLDSIGEDIPPLKDVEYGASVSFYMGVEGIEEFYQNIRSKVDVVVDLKTTWYGMKEFYIRDCNGYILAFAENSNE